MAIFKGAGVAIVTPFHEDGSINYEKFAELVEFQIAGGTDAIIVCGTTGESSTLTHEEHLDLIRFCIETVKGRIPVVAGTGSNCTETAVYLSTEAEKYGADGLLLVTPYYNKATQKGLFEHYKRIADSVKIPIILYNVPSRTGCNILPQTVVKLCSEVHNIVGIKEACGSISQITKLAALAQGKIDIYSGNDDQIVDVLERGGKGVISVLSNVCPQETHDIVANYLNGDIEGSKALMDKYMKLAKNLFCDVNPIPVKEAVNMIGFKAGHCRLPLIDMTDENKALMKETLTEYGLIK